MMQRYSLSNDIVEDSWIYKVPNGKYILYTDHLIKVGKLVAERDAAQIQNKFLAQEILIVREENRLLKEEFLERGVVWRDFVDRGQIPKVQGKPNPILPEESQEDL